MIMPPATIFAVPGLHQNTLQRPSHVVHKRKRKSHQDVRSQDGNPDQEHSSLLASQGSTEFTAIVTPAERSQRRLAGLALDQDVPTAPFPHASIANPSPDRKQGSRTTNRRVQYYQHQRSAVENTEPSLHAQHLASMTAILHRSLVNRDYERASRALGLILRNDVGGHAIDIRSEGLWGIGAEILFYRNDTDDHSIVPHDQHAIGHYGFERARIYYETLMIQYPQHQTWPDVINSRDFCNAMFGVWVYITCQERAQLDARNIDASQGEEDLGPRADDQVDLWELDQARKVAEAMDNRMRNIAFRNDRELIRLRGMVALWLADLLERRSEIEEEDRINQAHVEETLEEMDSLSGNIERINLHSSQAQNTNTTWSNDAITSRQLARALFDKLEDRADDIE